MKIGLTKNVIDDKTYYNYVLQANGVKVQIKESFKDERKLLYFIYANELDVYIRVVERISKEGKVLYKNYYLCLKAGNGSNALQIQCCFKDDYKVLKTIALVTSQDYE